MLKCTARFFSATSKSNPTHTLTTKTLSEKPSQTKVISQRRKEMAEDLERERTIQKSNFSDTEKSIFENNIKPVKNALHSYEISKQSSVYG